MSNKLLVIFIDEDKDQRRLMPRRLESAFGNGIEVNAIVPEADIESMVERIHGDSDNLRALVFDERLGETGEAIYSGSNLARAYREVDPVIPIFILTSYIDDEDLMERYTDFDHVLSKGDFRTIPVDKRIENLMRRSIGRFDQYVSERSYRMHCLLEKSILQYLTEDESDELNQLTTWKNGPTYLSEHHFQSTLKKKLDEREKTLNKILSKLDK